MGLKLVKLSIGFVVAGCDFPRPADVQEVDAAGSSMDATMDSLDASIGGVDAIDGARVDGPPSPVCTPNQPLRCDDDTLVRCNADGSAEIRESCTLGCDSVGVHCADVNPSNGLASALDMASTEPDFDFGAMATINTDDCAVVVAGQPIAVKHVTVAQNLAPAICVLVVRSLITGDVKIAGIGPVGIVSHGDIKIGGLFSASATSFQPGAGALNDGNCRGGPAGNPGNSLISGAGGGGFGQPGGAGGTASNNDATVPGGSGGSTAGNAMLVPLRGGCDSGTFGSLFGAGGGAVQLVSRSRITVSGIVAANGSAGSGGGSGGGILLEAPTVKIPGAVVANGGSGASGCILSTQGLGEDGRLDAMRAAGGQPCSSINGAGGAGGARSVGNGGNGQSISSSGIALAGYGGGGVGRIRINTTSDGLEATGVLSPNPSTGTIATR
jgi:hypothetical protein